jgi:hypothetical protein
LREGLIDECIKLVVDPIEGSTQRKGQDGVVAREHSDGGPEYAGFEAREQPGDFPAIGRDEVAVGARRAEDHAFERKAAQIVSHLAGGVFACGDAEQIGDKLPQVAIVESVDQVLEQSKGEEQSHHPGLAKLQCRRFFTVVGDGRLHHSLDAVAAQATVVADTFDFQQASIDLPPLTSSLHLPRLSPDESDGGPAAPRGDVQRSRPRPREFRRRSALEDRPPDLQCCRASSRFQIRSMHSKFSFAGDPQ